VIRKGTLAESAQVASDDRRYPDRDWRKLGSMGRRLGIAAISAVVATSPVELVSPARITIASYRRRRRIVAIYLPVMWVGMAVVFGTKLVIVSPPIIFMGVLCFVVLPTIAEVRAAGGPPDADYYQRVGSVALGRGIRALPFLLVGPALISFGHLFAGAVVAAVGGIIAARALARTRRRRREYMAEQTNS
jgi:hypothetical protein